MRPWDWSDGLALAGCVTMMMIMTTTAEEVRVAGYTALLL